MITSHHKIWLLIIFSSVLDIFQSKPCSPNNQQFFITFHPHLDAFWLNSDKQLKDINFTPAPFLYEMNQRNSKTILNSMLLALSQNATRKYFITEVVFFKDWYEYLDHQHQLKVQRLLTNNQLQIANGGWVENDEAVCYFDDIIDQYALGLHYLKSKLNYEVKIGWATDSFGHSHSQAALLHLMGFEFQAIERVDDRYIHQRNKNSSLEFYWAPVSDSNNLSYGGVVTYVRHFLHEVNNLRTTTPDIIAEDFKRIAKTMKQLYHKPKMFRFLGNDFEEFITPEFQTLEKAINLLNKPSPNKQCPIFAYGNPTDYLSLLKQEYKPQDMPIRKEDFMPNWDQDHYWTGYYTTDPDLKKVCKDFSRLVNLFRKICIKNNNTAAATFKLIDQSNELLALMQHHDGITATSKRHIEKQLKQRMRFKSQEIIKQVLLARQIPRQTCLLYKNGNKCSLDTREKTVFVSILHEGSTKTQKIELQLPKDVNYDIKGHKADYFCFDKLNKCSLVFEAEIRPGNNVFEINKMNQKVNAKDETVHINKVKGLSFSSQRFKIDLRNNQIDYTFNSRQYFNISLVKAKSEITITQTVAWNKYGQKEIKQERRIPGMYIMTNNGQLESINQGQFTELYLGVGKQFTKVYAYSQLYSIALTIRHGTQHILDIQTQFQPPNLDLSDYFLKVESNMHANNELYHDVNGYLVMKRKVGARPDYQWQYKAIDKIAANTYPFCSFGYILDHQKKLVVFTDRAGGISLFDQAMIINIDRITSDDYKGVGQAYMEIVRNVFHHKVALVNSQDFIERKWQKQFDEALIGSYSTHTRKASTSAAVKKDSEFLKYSIFTLSRSQFVLRLINLHDTKEIKLPRYVNNSWNLQKIGLHIPFHTLQDSFAHGGTISQRRRWKDIPNQINMFNYNQSDTHNDVVLKPLQIRSFRITLRQQQKQQQQHLRSTGKATSHSQKKHLKSSNPESERGQKQIHQANKSQNKISSFIPAKTKPNTKKQLGAAHMRKRCF